MALNEPFHLPNTWHLAPELKYELRVTKFVGEFMIDDQHTPPCTISWATRHLKFKI